MRFPQAFQCFAGEDTGSMTAFSIMIATSLLMLGGLAVDATGVMTDIVHLQAAADSAAHAALYTRDSNSADIAKKKAIDVARGNLPQVYFGDVLHTQDIIFGTWDETARQFLPDPVAVEAVQVRLDRTAANGNPYQTLVLYLANINAVDLQVQSTYEAYDPMCFREGFVADGVVDIQSNNAFTNGFCIHSNTYVSLNSNNFFEPGTVVSMPDLRTLQIPSSGMSTNTGLQAALRQGSYNIRVLSRVNDIIAHVADPSSPYFRSYITDPVPVTLTGSRIDASNLLPGHVYSWNCSGNSGTIQGNQGIISKVVIETSCPVKFANGAVFEDATILTTSTDAKSFSGPSGVVLGKNDNCAPGGVMQLVSKGGMDFAANLEMYGSQLLGIGQIKFAARANGVQGASMVSHVGVDGTSNMAMGFCGTGMEGNFVAKYFRLVR